MDLPVPCAWHKAADTNVNLAAEFIVLTAVRTGEARFMRAREVDFAEKLWTIPAERMKTEDDPEGSPFEVPLSDRAVSILKDVIPKGASPNAYVFVGQANASKHKAMSYDRMKKREAELEVEVDRWLKTAEAADAEEDKLYGDKRGDEMPDWVADKQRRLEKIREGKAALEAEAKAAVEAESKARAEAEDKRQADGRKRTGKPPTPPKAEPDGKAQRNFTDPESRILKTTDGYIQGYNAQAKRRGKISLRERVPPGRHWFGSDGQRAPITRS